MENNPPATPKVAWEEEGSSQESIPSLLSFCDETPMQPLQFDASWLPVYELSEDAVDFIVAFASSLNKECPKVTFLKSAYVLCKTALKHGLTQGLDLFCQTCKVVENIMDLLEKEPRDCITSQIRYLAMITINELCLVENVLKGKTKSLLSACFSSVLLLPAEKEMPYQSASLYIKTLKAMDTMLTTVVLSFPTSSVSKELQDIFEVLLDFTRSEREVVRKRAVGRLGVLTHLLANYSTLKASVNFGRDNSEPVSPEDISVPAMGRLVGRLILFRYSKEQTSYTAFQALCSLAEFLYKSRPRDDSDQLSWEVLTPTSLCYLSTTDCTQAFGKYLRPSERTDVIVEAIEAMRHDSIPDTEVPSNMLDVTKEDPDFWLTDVPKIVSSILENLLCIRTESGCRSVNSLFHLMTDKYTSAVVIGLCQKALQGDRAVQELCDVLSLTPVILEKVITEFDTLLLNHWCNPPREGTHTFHRAPSLEQIDREFDDKPNVCRDQGHSKPVMALLMLEALARLLERTELAQRIEVFLPSMMRILEVGSELEKLRIVVVLQSVLGRLKKSKASSFAVAVMGRILPLLDSDSSQLRKFSLYLLTDLLRSVVTKDEKMRKEVRRALIPLLFHVNDQHPSVAKASREALFAAAEFLRWNRLQHLLLKERMWELAGCLLMRRGSRAEEYMQQSLPYLRDTQASVRLAAVRFIGIATRQLRNQDFGARARILSAVESLETDKDISISSLAALTAMMLRSPRERRRCAVIRELLCCCCC